MEISLGLFIFGMFVSIFILYVVIETAVRRGIDSSKTHSMIKELLEKKNGLNN